MWNKMLIHPNRHSTILKIEHVMHDERVWGILFVVAMITVLIVTMILLSVYGKPVSGQWPNSIPPYYW